MYPKKGATLPIRLTDDEKASLQEISSETGLAPSTLVRLLITALVSYYAKNGRKLILPIQWKELVEIPLDRRTPHMRT